jgi:hypothetical protein
MEEPIRPQEPGSRMEDKEQIQHALACGFIALKKAFPNILVESEMRGYSEPSGTLTIRIPGTAKEWKEYEVACGKYRADVEAYTAFGLGVTPEQYRAAKKKAEGYNYAKCDKKDARTPEYYLFTPVEQQQDPIVIGS